MGTRNLTQVTVDGTIKIAQYGQWDGYPSHTGVEIAKFLHSADLDTFTDAVRECRFVTDDEVESLHQECFPGPGTADNAAAFLNDFPEFSRDTGCEILSVVLDRGARALVDQSDFINDALFCEWAYLIDLDAKTVTVVCGYDGVPDHMYLFSEFTPEAMQELEDSID